MNFGEVMEAIADAVKAADIDGVGERCFGWPIGQVPVPCLVVGYPEGDIDLNLVSGAQLVRAKYPVWWIVGGAPTDRTAPKRLGAAVQEIKAAIDAMGDDEDSPVDSALVLTASIQPINVGEATCLAVQFVVDIVS